MLTKIIYNKLIERNEEDSVYRPLFFRLNNEADRKAFTFLLEDRPGIRVYETIKTQLKELVKSFTPKRSLSQGEISEKITAHLSGIDPHQYGVWVYYPWSDRLVHLLDEHEFVAMRTNRNKYKITDKEEDTLATKRVGVVGLSVGQSVSLTMAMERTFGELRIADFDDLEITNLNRLRSGVHNMGLLKTVLVAREIAEIDPFLKVTCFHEGITEDNLDSFLLDNGKLDVLIDECDGVDIKIACRIAARKYRIPVLMEASDRGTIDIERFDLEPDRPILHGYIEHLDVSKVKGLKTMEEKLPFILPIVGIETMSARLKASAVEIGQSIATWPQLASAVTMGGGITADICRKVLLGQLSVSGRYFFDVDDFIDDEKKQLKKEYYDLTSISVAEMAAAAAQLPADSMVSTVTDAAITEILAEAVRQAPSAGNNQPWKLYNDGKRLLLFDDPLRSAAFANFRNMISNMSLGSAIENMHLRALENGVSLDIELFPLKGKSNPVAAIAVKQSKGEPKDELVNYLGARHTSRKLGNGKSIDKSVLEEIRKAALGRDIKDVKMVVEPDSVNRIADITGIAEKLRMFIPQGHNDLFTREIRWDKESAEKTKDGLDIRTLELKAKDEIGFKVIQDPKAIELVHEWNLGSALENMTKDLVASSSAVCLITGHKYDSVNCVNAGRALQRVYLAAEKYKVEIQPVMAAVFHFARIVHANGEGLPDDIQREFRRMHTEFVELFNLTLRAEEPLFLMRLFYAEQPAVKSIRLDIEDVYFKNPHVN